MCGGLVAISTPSVRSCVQQITRIKFPDTAPTAEETVHGQCLDVEKSTAMLEPIELNDNGQEGHYNTQDSGNML